MQCDICKKEIEIEIKHKEDYKKITCSLCALIACEDCFNATERLCCYCEPWANIGAVKSNGGCY